MAGWLEPSMPGASQCSGVVYDSHGRGLAAPESDLVFVKPHSPEDRKEFLPLGFTAVWAVPDGVQKGLHWPGVHPGETLWSPRAEYSLHFWLWFSRYLLILRQIGKFHTHLKNQILYEIISILLSSSSSSASSSSIALFIYIPFRTTSIALFYNILFYVSLNFQSKKKNVGTT